MSEQERSPAQYAADIDGARDRLIAFVESYLAGWMRTILRWSRGAPRRT